MIKLKASYFLKANFRYLHDFFIAFNTIYIYIYIYIYIISIYMHANTKKQNMIDTDTDLIIDH